MDESVCPFSILSKLTPQKYDLLKDQLIYSEITTADTLMGIASFIFDKAVLQPTLRTMYAQLCSDIYEKVPCFPSDKPGHKQITFRRLLLNNCQHVFEGADKLTEELKKMTTHEQESDRKDKENIVKLRLLGNICFIGELIKWKVIPERVGHHIVQLLLGRLEPGSNICPEGVDVEAICQFFNIVGKQLDEFQDSRYTNDCVFIRLKELRTNLQLTPRIRFMVHDVLDLRSNRWFPRRIEVKANKYTRLRKDSNKRKGNNRSMAAGSRGLMPGTPSDSKELHA